MRVHAGIHWGGQDSSPGQIIWDLWQEKWHWDRFSPSVLVSFAILSTDCSTLIIIIIIIIIIHHPGLKH
jgi:hypothetical protein